MGGRARGICCFLLAWWGVQVLPFGILFGDFKRHFFLEGFLLEKQLGRGRTSEAWLAQPVGVANNSSVVLKIRSRGIKFPDLIALSLGHSCHEECSVARQLSAHFSSHFLNCSRAGVVDVGGMQLEFVAYDVAPGQSLEDLVTSHSLMQKPPPELRSLEVALDTFLRIFEIVDGCVRPSASHTRFYFPDLQIGNVLVTQGGDMTLIDYDRIETCCDAQGYCAGGIAPCDLEVDMSWLFILQQRLLMILIQLLIGVLPSRTRFFIHFEARVFRAWQITACRKLIKQGYHGPRPNLTEVVEVITSQVFPEYREAWERLPNSTGLLGQAYLEAHEVEPPWPPGFIGALRHQRSFLG